MRGALVSSYMVTLADLPAQVTELLGPLMDHPRILMAAVMLLLLAIGTVMDLTPTILVLGPVLMPLAVKAGIDPTYFGVMFILVGTLGLIHPPVCTVLNVVCGVARISLESATRGVWPFLLAYIVLIFLFVVFPGLITGPDVLVPLTPIIRSKTMKNFIKPCWSSLAVRRRHASAAHAADYKPHIDPLRLRPGGGQQPGPRRQVPRRGPGQAHRRQDQDEGLRQRRLGSDMQMQNALIGGAQEMMVVSTATLVGIVKDFGVYDLPFLFDNEKEADAVLDGPFGQKLMAKLQDKGLVGLVYWENGFRNLTNSKHPDREDGRPEGHQAARDAEPVYIDMFNSLGANAVPLPFSELFTALETKTVDGQENPVNTIESSKFYEVQKYLSHDQPRVQPVDRAGQQEVVGRPVGRREEGRAGRRPSHRATSSARTAAPRRAQALEDLKKKGMQVTV